MLKALASHHCGPGSIHAPSVTCGLSLLLFLIPAPRVFLRVLWFSPSTKTNVPNSNSIHAFDHHIMLKCALQVLSIYLLLQSLVIFRNLWKSSENVWKWSSGFGTKFGKSLEMSGKWSSNSATSVNFAVISHVNSLL